MEERLHAVVTNYAASNPAQKSFSITYTDLTTASMKCYPAKFFARKVYVHGDMIVCCHPVL